MKNWKNILLLAVMVVLGVLELSTDLIPTLLEQTGAPEWIGTVIRIVALVCTVIRAVLTVPPDKLEAFLGGMSQRKRGGV